MVSGAFALCFSATALILLLQLPRGTQRVDHDARKSVAHSCLLYGSEFCGGEIAGGLLISVVKE